MRPIFLLLFLVLFTARSAAAQEALVSVRELYASAEYEEALTALGRLRGETAINDSLELDHYRVLCLIALGRSMEADEVIETIVKSDPLYEPDADAAPRIRAAYSSVRRRVSPAVARRLYTEGKAAFDRKAFEDAADRLELVLKVIDKPDAGDSSELADLRTLASGFLDLSRASVPSKLPAISPPVANNTTPPPPAPPPVLPPPTDPVVVRQELPRWSTAVAGNLFEAEFKGIVEVEIDEQGDVVSASIVEPIHPAYDKLLLKAAREWKYEPARRSGQPVKVRKRVDIVLRPR